MSNGFTAWSANVSSQNWSGFPDREDALAEIYKNSEADLIGFQEFSVNLKDILKRMNPKFQYVMGERLWDLYVNPIGYNPYRFTPVDEGTFWLSKDNTKVPGWDSKDIRATTWAVFEDITRRRDQRLLIVNTHLDNISKQARIGGTKKILEFIKKKRVGIFQDIPIIITGDFNICIDSPGLSYDGQARFWADPNLRELYDLILQAGFVDTWKEIHPNEMRPFTYQKFVGHKYDVAMDKFAFWDPDYIFAKKLKTVKVGLIDQSHENIYASDHFFPYSFFEYVD